MQIQTMMLEGESRILAWNWKFSGRKLSWISISTSSMSRTLKWSAAGARRAKVLDVIGMWIDDGGANVATCQTRISKARKMFHALAPLLMNKSGALPARLKLLEITVLASLTWGCDVKCYNNKELQRLNTTHLEMVCGIARIRKATHEP